MSAEQQIKDKALELGFDLVGITDAAPLDARFLNSFANWLDAGHAADMHYMQKNLDKRFDPKKLLANAKSIICLGLNYKPTDFNTEQKTSKKPRGKVVSYALYEDYHQFIKNKLRWLVTFLDRIVGHPFKFILCVDSIPIAERAFAQRAGLGFIAKNHILINPELGTQIFLAEIITNLDLKPDPPFNPLHEKTNEYLTSINCSRCSKCIDACPTAALQPDGSFDARRCISYLTVEHKGEIPSHLKRKIEDRLFGCEQCLLVCPYQKNAPFCKNKDFRFYPERARIDLRRILSLTDRKFNEEFDNSPIKRIGIDRIKRNADICFENITSRKE